MSTQWELAMASYTPAPFGVLLKRYRRRALLTQEQLAGRARLSSDTIRALESGKRRTPRPESAHLLADALALAGAEREEFLAAVAPAERDTSTDAPAAIASWWALGAPQPSPLIGRDSELETIRQRLADARHQDAERARLLTLTGPAGVGKTRIALAAATQLAQVDGSDSAYPDGVVLVDLAPVHDAAAVLSTIARAVGLADVGGRPLLQRLCEHLRERSMLLALDNFEHVLPAASALAKLLASCPGLALLVTSRVPLRLRWEWLLRVPPLPAPDLSAPLPPLDVLQAIPAVALFLERARARRSDFALTAAQAPLIARLVSELDGLPLALELAAARLDALPLPLLVRRLSDRLRLLRWEASDLPERQRSLEAAVGWSYDLLNASEQGLFRGLGVFAGQVALPAITAVWAATQASAARSADPVRPADRPTSTTEEAQEQHALEALASLAEKSLLLAAWPPADSARAGDGAGDGGPYDARDEADTDGAAEPAFAMLETVREYAWEQLERQDELTAARRAHAHYFLELAERADPHLRGPRQLVWYARLEREHNNLRAAVRWLLSQEGAGAAHEREAGLRLAATLGWFWWTRGYIAEGASWLGEALDCVPEADPMLRARALRQQGAMLAYQGAIERAGAALEEALATALRGQNPAEIAQSIAYQGLCAVYAGQASSGIPLLREALRRGRELGDRHMLGMTLMFLGAATLAQGDDEQARAVYEESRAHFMAAGDGLFSANIQLNLGWFAWQHDDLPSAIDHTRVAVEVGVTADNRRLLGFAAQMALVVVRQVTHTADEGEAGETAARAALVARARLLGAIDALNQATGMTLMQMVVQSSLTELREVIQLAGLEAEYRRGRALSLEAIAALTRDLLDEMDQTAPGLYALRTPHRRLAERHQVDFLL